jgi:hypothetical protein
MMTYEMFLEFGVPLGALTASSSSIFTSTCPCQGLWLHLGFPLAFRAKARDLHAAAMLLRCSVGTHDLYGVWCWDLKINIQISVLISSAKPSGFESKIIQVSGTFRAIQWKVWCFIHCSSSARMYLPEPARNTTRKPHRTRLFGLS